MTTTARTNADLRTILSLEVPLVVRLGERSMDMGELVALTPGSIIELTKSAEDELDVLVNNRTIGTGTAVKLGENFGIRISSIGKPAARVEALGTPPEPEETLSNDEAAELAARLLAGQ
jgi:flagellar motor switch protein FliN/FliY